MRGNHLALGLAMAAATLASFLAPDAATFPEPSLARVIFFHLPCALVTSGLLFVSAWFGIQQLRTRRMDWDARVGATLELGALFALLTMLTGIYFSKVQWGAWWQNDPRQTSFLMVLMLYAGALAVRGGIGDDRKRAAASAAYAVAMLLPAVFLIFVFPRLPMVVQQSFHPSDTISGGKMTGAYRWVTLLNIGLFAWTCAVLYKLRLRTSLIELEIVERDGLDETGRGGPAAPRVVRPVDVPEGD